MASILVERGVDLALGIPGGTISALYDAVLETPSIRYVQTAHETAAIFAAAAYAQQTGKVAVVMVTSGPGVLNTTTALASAKADNLPLLLLVGEVLRENQGRFPLQDGSAHELDIVGSLRALCKHAATIPTASAAGPMLHDALHRATSGRPGPVVLTIPMDISLSSESPVRMPAVPAQFMEPVPDVSDVARVLREATSPLLLVGSGCRAGPGPDAVRALAEHLDAAVVTTPKAKGVFPDSHRLSRGIFGLAGHDSAARAARSADVILALGTSMGELATSTWSPDLRAPTLIQIDVDGSRIGRTYPVDHAVQSTVGAFASAVVRTVPQAPAVREDLPVSRLGRSSTGGPGLNPVDAIRELQHVLPRSTTFVVDSGEHTLFALHHLHVDAPDGFVAMLGLGSMGSGIAGALGVALAAPERTVACICGDGGMLMHLGELATAAREGLPVRFFVFDDQRLGMVGHGMRALYGQPHTFSNGPTDFVQIARGLGVAGFRIEHPGELVGLEEVFRHHPGPVLVAIRIDPEAQFPKGARLAALGTP